jgi:hypothetical protein
MRLSSTFISGYKGLVQSRTLDPATAEDGQFINILEHCDGILATASFTLYWTATAQGFYIRDHLNLIGSRI